MFKVREIKNDGLGLLAVAVINQANKDYNKALRYNNENEMKRIERDLIENPDWCDWIKLNNEKVVSTFRGRK